MGNISTNGTITASGFNGNATSATKATQDGNGNVISSTYLPLSGGKMKGDIGFQGTKSSPYMIRFLDNTEEQYSNGIAVGNGGLTIIGGGEASTAMINGYSSILGFQLKTENLLLGADTSVWVYSKVSAGLDACYSWCFNTNGKFYSGAIVYDSTGYGNSLPSSGVKGQVFYKLT